MAQPREPEVALIEVCDLVKTYKVGDCELRALDGVSLRVAGGEMIAIMGPSGSGKSTFLHLLGCLDLPDSGSYRFGGIAVESLDGDGLAQIRNQRIGFVFQQFNLLPRMSALRNVELPLLYSRMGKTERAARAIRRLRQVGLGDRLQHQPRQLSGGQQQRVAIARALVNDPALVLADEPTGALDSRTSREVMQLLRQLNREGITVILVTHEPAVADFAARIVMFRDGRIVSDQPHPSSPDASCAG